MLSTKYFGPSFRRWDASLTCPHTWHSSPSHRSVMQVSSMPHSPSSRVSSPRVSSHLCGTQMMSGPYWPLVSDEMRSLPLRSDPALSWVNALLVFCLSSRLSSLKAGATHVLFTIIIPVAHTVSSSMRDLQNMSPNDERTIQLS